MDKEKLDFLSDWFESYAMSYADKGVLPKAAECKLVHTREVRAASARIASSPLGAGLSGSLALLAECGGLLHDVARFEQYKLHKTFSDRKSFDHGEAGARIIMGLKLCDGLPKPEQEMLIEAVRLHNKPVLPPGLDPQVEIIAKIVRDADKVGIIQFLARYLNEEADYWKDPVISLEMPETEGFTEEVAVAAMEGRMVMHKDLRCLNDFLISLFAWPVDLNYAESARMLLEQGLYHKIGSHLPPSPLLDEMMDASSLRLLALAGMS